MPWFRIDDGWHNHPKVIAAGNTAAGLWARCGSYCSQHPSLEGRVPLALAHQYGTPKDCARLVDVGLWARDGEFYVFPDWLDFNPSAEAAEAKKAAAAERQRRAREKAASRRDTDRDSQRDEAVSHAPPDPTRPDPLLTGCTETTDDSNSQPASVVVDPIEAVYVAARLMANELASTARNVQDRNAWIAATTKGIIRERSEDIARLLGEGMTAQQAAEFLTGTSRRDHIRLIDSPQVDVRPLHGPWLPAPPAVSQDEHIERVRARAAGGDEQAKEELAVWEKRLARKAAVGGSQ